MGKKFVINEKHHILFACFPIIYLLIVVCQIVLSALGFTQVNGVLQAMGFSLCLVLVMLDYRKGRIISYILFGLSFLNIISSILHNKEYTAVSGLVNIFIYIITVSILSWQIARREKLIITDSVTGLMNRRGLFKFLEVKLKSETPFDVSVISIDNFKILNDNHGREYGDRLLSYVAETSKNILGDRGNVFRLAGPEFVITIDDTLQSDSVVSEILEALSDKFFYENDGAKFANYLSIYAGISRYPDDSRDYDDLINYADMAMLHAANNRKKRFLHFTKDMEEQVKDDVDIEKLIEEGLNNDYFYMMYQPQYRIGDKSLRGFESLIRMKKPDGEMVSPGKFIPVAERSELIMKIDNYVLHRVLEEFKDIVIKANKSFLVSVNISAKNIANIGYADSVLEVIEEIGFPPECLEIEITEYCLAKSVDVAIDNIEKLRSMGVQVALDDFGTGYTSLNYLAKLPINLLKIDKSMIDDIVTDNKSKDFVNAIISLGHMMNCEVISEGVEDENQVALLREQQCDFVQGFIWSRPLMYDDAVKEVK